MTSVAVLEVHARESVANAYDFLEAHTRKGLENIQKALPEARTILVTDAPFANHLGNSVTADIVTVPTDYWNEELHCLRLAGSPVVRKALGSTHPDNVVVLPGASAACSPDEIAQTHSRLLDSEAGLVMGVREVRDNPCQLNYYFKVSDINLLHPIEQEEKTLGEVGVDNGSLLTAPFVGTALADTADGIRSISTTDGFIRLAIPANLIATQANVLAVSINSLGHIAGWIEQHDSGAILRLNMPEDRSYSHVARLFLSADSWDQFPQTGHNSFLLEEPPLSKQAMPYIILSQSVEMEADFWETPCLEETEARLDPVTGRIINKKTMREITGRQDFPEAYDLNGSMCAFRWMDASAMKKIINSCKTDFLQQSEHDLFYEYLEAIQSAPKDHADLPKANTWNWNSEQSLIPPVDAARRDLAHLNVVQANAIRLLSGSSLTFFGQRLAQLNQQTSSRYLELVENQGLFDKQDADRLNYKGAFGHGALAKPVSVMQTQSGEFLVADYATHELQLFSPQFEPTSRNNQGFNCPEHFFRDGNEAVMLCDWQNKRIVEITSAGDLKKEIRIADYRESGTPYVYPASACFHGDTIFAVVSSDIPTDKQVISFTPGSSEPATVYDTSLLLTPKGIANNNGQIMVGDFDSPTLISIDPETGTCTPSELVVTGIIRSMEEFEGKLFIATPHHIFVYDHDTELVDFVDIRQATGKDNTNLRDLWIDENSRTLLVADKGQRCVHCVEL